MEIVQVMFGPPFSLLANRRTAFRQHCSFHWIDDIETIPVRCTHKQRAFVNLKESNRKVAVLWSILSAIKLSGYRS